MRIEKIKAMTIAELQKENAERQTKLHLYQLDIKSGKEKDTSKVKSMRHDIARIQTMINLKTVTTEITEQVEVTKKETATVKESRVAAVDTK